MATHAITDLAIVLKPEDDVAIAKREIAAGTVLEDADGRDRGAAGHQARPQDRAARRAGGRRRCAATGSHRLRHRRDRGRGSRAHAEPGRRRAAPGLRVLAPTCSRWTSTRPRECATSTGTRARTAGSGRATTSAIISGGQLLGEREPVRQGQVPRRAEGVPERRRRARDHPQVGLRHQAVRRGPHGAAARPRRLRQAPERRRPTS